MSIAVIRVLYLVSICPLRALETEGPVIFKRLFETISKQGVMSTAGVGGARRMVDKENRMRPKKEK